MQFSEREDGQSSCPKTGKEIGGKRKHRWVRWVFPIVGLLSLIWFLIRVLPKPSRAAYPCQRVAMPLASGFVIWLLGLFGSASAYRKAKRCFAGSRYVLGIICVVVSIGCVWLALSATGEQVAPANPQPPNDPIGTAKGIHPGRVVWIHDPYSTDWAGVGDGHWWESNHTDQAVVDKMMSRAIRGIAGKATDAAAWDEIFRYFNQAHGKGDIGYQPGEKIMIKVNFVGCICDWTIWFQDCVSDETWNIIESYIDYMNTSPQMMLALLKQLVNVVGVSQEDISIGDTICNFPNEYHNILHNVFPDVHYLDYEAELPSCPGRTGINKNSGIYIYWSGPDQAENDEYEQVPICYTDAEYVINMANLKSHISGGAITLCGKNHYGSLKRGPANLPYQEGFYDLHKSLPGGDEGTPGMGHCHYRAIVDMMGHPDIGGKTVLFLIDGLYPGKHHNPAQLFPLKWNSSPFNGDWTSSLFVSLDPVAIDSVGFDFLLEEWPEAPGPDQSGADDYLHEAAKANNPDSETFYDPDGGGSGLDSLGTHEHWNDATNKEYSRNLGYDEGIELISADGDIENNGYGLGVIAAYWLSNECGNDNNWCDGADFDFSSTVDFVDFAAFTQHWLDGTE
jgi:hypothetical protein